MTNSFDSLYENLISEMMPIDIVPGYSGTGEETEASFPEKAVKYSLTPEQTKEVASKVVAKLREMGGHSDKTYKEFQEEDIADVVKEVAGHSGTNSKYAARVIHTALKSAGIITDERDGTKLVKSKPSEDELKEVADTAASDEGTEEETVSEPSVETTEEENLVYYKSADFDVDDAELEKKWNKIPEGNLEWDQIVKLVGTSSALKLLEKGALLSTEKEEEKEEETDEEGNPREIPTIETDEEDEEGRTIKNPEKLTSNFNRTFSPFAHSEE